MVANHQAESKSTSPKIFARHIFYPTGPISGINITTMLVHEILNENPFLTRGLQALGIKSAAKSAAPAVSVAKNIEQFPIANILNSKGGIGTQGVSPYQMSDLFNNVLGVKTPPNATMEQLITMLKSNPSAQAKLRDFTAKNPIQIRRFPDNYYEVADGNHRAYLLYKLGDKTIPAVVK